MKEKEQVKRLKTMGLFFILFGLVCSGITFFLPHDETLYLLSSAGKEGTYVLSSFFFFLGFYCWGAVWRKKHFLS